MNNEAGSAKRAAEPAMVLRCRINDFSVVVSNPHRYPHSAWLSHGLTAGCGERSRRHPPGAHAVIHKSTRRLWITRLPSGRGYAFIQRDERGRSRREPKASASPFGKRRYKQ